MQKGDCLDLLHQARGDELVVGLERFELVLPLDELVRYCGELGLDLAARRFTLVDLSPRLRQQRTVRLVGAVELPANLIEQLAVDFLCVGRSAGYGVECLLDPFGDIAAGAQLRIVE